MLITNIITAHMARLLLHSSSFGRANVAPAVFYSLLAGDGGCHIVSFKDFDCTHGGLVYSCLIDNSDDGNDIEI